MSGYSVYHCKCPLKFTLWSFSCLFMTPLPHFLSCPAYWVVTECTALACCRRGVQCQPSASFLYLRDKLVFKLYLHYGCFQHGTYLNSDEECRLFCFRSSEHKEVFLFFFFFFFLWLVQRLGIFKLGISGILISILTLRSWVTWPNLIPLIPFPSFSKWKQ